MEEPEGGRYGGVGVCVMGARRQEMSGRAQLADEVSLEETSTVQWLHISPFNRELLVVHMGFGIFEVP